MVFFITRQIKTGLFIALLTIMTPVSQPAHAQSKGDPDFLTLSAGWFDFNRQKDQAGEFRLEYRSDKKFWIFKPFLTASATSSGMTFVGAGILTDVYFGRRWVVTPSFAPTYWRGKTDDLDLGYALEFRSQLEVAYRFDDRSRLGLSISHYSNAGLGDTNPGTEQIMLNYSMPFGKLSRMFD